MKRRRLVLTGAAGRLGSYLREPLSKLADEVDSSDLADDIGALDLVESYVSSHPTDLAQTSHEGRFGPKRRGQHEHRE